MVPLTAVPIADGELAISHGGACASLMGCVCEDGSATAFGATDAWLVSDDAESTVATVVSLGCIAVSARIGVPSSGYIGSSVGWERIIYREDADVSDSFGG